MTTERLRCPVCESARFVELDRRRDIPIAQNLIFPDQAAARACAVGQLRMLRCQDCGFAWNAAFDPAIMVYDATYDNDQNFSGVFRAHVDAVAGRVAGLAPGQDPVDLLEVGCGQGSFLSILRDRLGDRMRRAIGFDPAWKGDGRGLPPGAAVIGDYFDAARAQDLPFRPDLIVSRHTIEHVPDPSPFLAAMRAAGRPGTRILIETPTVDWILAGGVFFDFFYEHCSLFDPHSLALAMRRAGLAVETVETAFDGQYLVAVGAIPAQDGQAAAGPDAATPPGGFDDLGYRALRDAYLARFRTAIGAAEARGEKVALWGGASKGVTVALMLGEDRERLACAIDINPRKQGCFLPGTGVPILGPEQAAALGVTAAIVLNHNYAEEIRRDCLRRGLPITVLTI